MAHDTYEVHVIRHDRPEMEPVFYCRTQSNAKWLGRSLQNNDQINGYVIAKDDNGNLLEIERSGDIPMMFRA